MLHFFNKIGPPSENLVRNKLLSHMQRDETQTKNLKINT